MTNYKLTDEGLEALVEGKLKCKKIANAASDGGFLVEYNALVVSPDDRTVVFMYEDTPIFLLELPHMRKGDTCTVRGLEGRITLTIST